MVEEKIKEILSLRLKKLGYHLIRVKLINVNTKKTLQIMAERIKDKKMNIGLIGLGYWGKNLYRNLIINNKIISRKKNP